MNESSMNFSGLRAIAMMEALKGVLALLVAVGVHALAGVDLHAKAQKFLEQYHVSTHNHHVASVLHSLDRIPNSGLMVVTLIAVSYAMIRFVEAYGLWHYMRWTEWFTFLSGAIYLPFEIYEVCKDANSVTLSVLGINIAAVSYLYYILKTGGEQHARTVKKIEPPN